MNVKLNKVNKLLWYLFFSKGFSYMQHHSGTPIFYHSQIVNPIFQLPLRSNASLVINKLTNNNSFMVATYEWTCKKFNYSMLAIVDHHPQVHLEG